MNEFEQSVLPDFEARTAAINHARKHGEVTIDDVRRACPPPDDADPRVNGAIFRSGDLWTISGYRASSRKACHSRPVAVWRLRGVV